MSSWIERYATINGYEINFCFPSGTWEIVSIQHGVAVGYKTTRRHAEKFAFGLGGDGSGKTWEKYRILDTEGF